MIAVWHITCKTPFRITRNWRGSLKSTGVQATGSFRPPKAHSSFEDTDDLFMRRRLLTLLLAAVAAITMAVPLWAALRSERGLIGNATLHLNGQSPSPPVAEAATLVFTGVMLLGLASAVRRTG
jgi:hypothetical protein